MTLRRQATVLGLIKKNQGITRAMLAEMVEFSESTVIKCITQLMKEGAIVKTIRGQKHLYHTPDHTLSDEIIGGSVSIHDSSRMDQKYFDSLTR